jgi:hypothetical protein
MIRVLVAEDMRILRDTLVAVLNLEDDIDVVAQVADGQAIVPAVVADRPEHRRSPGHVLCSRSGAREPWPVVAGSAQFAGPGGLWSGLPGRAGRFSWRGGFP